MLRLDHVWAWRLVSDENQRPLPQRRAGSPNFLLQLRQPLLGGGWGPGRKGSAEDSQGTQETVSTEVKDTAEVVSPETGARAETFAEGRRQWELPASRGWPSGLRAPEELVLSGTHLCPCAQTVQFDHREVTGPSRLFLDLAGWKQP